jgi:pimeloyl-ACP methyl ester carboxylesterase
LSVLTDLRNRRSVWLTVAIIFGLVLLPFAFAVPDIPVQTLRAKYGSPASQYIEVSPGLTVHLRDQGPRDAPVLVLLHGSNASLHTWEPWVARLSDRYRIVSFDLPAHGLTGPNPSGDYSAAAYAKVVRDVVDKLGLGNFVLAGNSMGGGIAARFAADHPDRVRGLILVDASGRPTSQSNDLPLALRIAQTPGIREIAAEITPRWMIAQSLDGAVSVKSVMTPAAIDRYWELLRYPGNRAATITRFSQGYSKLSVDDLKRLTMPVLVLWGRNDKFIPVSSAAWFSANLPHSRVVIYDGVGHIPMEEAPDRSANDVAAFMAALPPAAPSP